MGFFSQMDSQLVDSINNMYFKCNGMFGEMTKAGAEVVKNNVKATVPLPAMRDLVKVTRTYLTPSDGGINTKVYLSGYLPFTQGRTHFTRKGANGTSYTTTEGVPVDFLCNLYEYGRSNEPFPKRPFLRRAFKNKLIEENMLRVQEEWMKKIVK